MFKAVKENPNKDKQQNGQLPIRKVENDTL